MSRNTKEVALIQIRQGNISELPKALHQAEFGLGKDANRVFIGNGENNILKNRTEFPYQNLELLTEMSDLSKYFTYTYENNIHIVQGVENRNEYKESMPIVVYCSEIEPSAETNMISKINGCEVNIQAGSNMNKIIDSINSLSSITHTYATQLTGTRFITLLSLTKQLTFEDISGNLSEIIGFSIDYSNMEINLPSRFVSDKFDDILLISDFGIKADNQENVAEKFHNSLIEIYKNGNNSQFFRKVELQAGQYLFEPVYVDEDKKVDFSFPLLSNTHICGHGIDRTILNVNGYTNSFMRSYNDNLSSNEVNADTLPHNIIIEDMTIVGNSEILCNLMSVSNATFNRVKFVGNGGNYLLNISGYRTSKMSSNITIKDCIFENANHAINILGNSKNITIDNCLFKNIMNKTIIFNRYVADVAESSANDAWDGTYSKTVTHSTVSNCCFENCSYVSDAQAVIYCDKKSAYICAINNKFDDNVYNRVGNTIPFKSENDMNYCNTYDPNTSKNKYLRFDGEQPKWDYVSALYDENGNVIFNGGDMDPNISFKTVNDNMEIKSKVKKDTKLYTNPTSNIVLGLSLDNTTVPSGEIVLMKDLNLNGKNIGSNDDIDIILGNNKLLELDTSKNTTKYEYLINNRDNAIPNVAFVKNISKHSIMKPVDYKALELMSGEMIPLVLFDQNVYGNDMHITRVSLDVTKPFYQLNQNNAINYNIGLKFEKGDLVTNGTDYYTVVKPHIVEEGDTVENNSYLVKVTLSDKPSVKYIDLIGYASNGQLYDISSIYRPSFLTNGNKFVSGVNLQSNEKHGLTNCRKYVYGERYSNGEFIELNGLIFKTNYKDGSQTKQLTKEGFYNPDYAERIYVEGYNYIFDLEKELFNMSENSVDTDDTLLNWANGKLFLRLLDENRNPLSNVSAEQFNPGGEVIVRVEMIKHEELIRPEIETFTVIVHSNLDDATIKLTHNNETFERNTINVSFGAEVSYEVSREGYETKTGTIRVYKDESIYVYLDQAMSTLTVNTDPTDATVVLTAPGYEQVDNTITVANGTDVLINVSKEGYIEYNDRLTITEDKNIDVILEKDMVTLTINPTPYDSTVVLTADGYEQVGNSITVHAGTEVSISVSKFTYESFEDKMVVNETQTVDVLLKFIEPELVTLTIEPTPEDATVVFRKYGEIVETMIENTIVVLPSEVVNVTVSKEGYIEYTEDIYVENDMVRTVTLEPMMVTLTVNVMPPEGVELEIIEPTIELLCQGYKQVDNTITVPYNKPIDISVNCSGWVSHYETLSITEDTIHNITLYLDIPSYYPVDVLLKKYTGSYMNVETPSEEDVNDYTYLPEKIYDYEYELIEVME